jgi:hypothetical protein
MKYLFLIVILSIFFISCSKEEKKETSGNAQKKDSVQVQSKNNQVDSLRGVIDSLKDAERESKNKTEEFSDILYNIKNIPSEFKYSGKVVASATWTDKNGENYILITETKEKETPNKKYPGERFLSKELYGYHYCFNDGNTNLLWKINDFVKDCEFDLTLDYIKKSLSITDINKDGIGESTFLYKLTCRSDVSPCDLKLIMHEGETKYAIRGSMVIKITNQKPYGGEMNIDNSFNSAPDGFLDYAKKQWNLYKTEKLN